MPPSWFESARRRVQRSLRHAFAWLRRHHRSAVLTYRKAKDHTWKRLRDTYEWVRTELPPQLAPAWKRVRPAVEWVRDQSKPLRDWMAEQTRPAFAWVHRHAVKAAKWLWPWVDRAVAFVRRHPHESTAAGLGLGVILIALLGYQTFKRPGDVLNPDADFQAGQAPPTQQQKRDQRTPWPVFGGNAARTKFLPAKGIDPPFAVKWRFESGQLIEFPPVYAAGRIFGMNNDADFFALNARTGRVQWRKRIGILAAASPAYAKGRLYGVTLSPGRAFALRASNGEMLWRKPLPGRSESSPLVDGNRVYFGCECGALYAVDARNGRTIWSTQLGGAIKGGPALYNGVLYVGDYGGHMSAVRASNGSIAWQTGAQGASFGRTGEFYSTPAVAYGRVYAGNNDGRIYSFEQSSGDLAWSHSLGGYVYSGPAVASGMGTPPSVYVGSFGGSIYALDARTGAERWRASAGGRVSGAVSVVGRTAYVSNIESDTLRSYAFDIRSGRRVAAFRHGQYTPVISDGKWIYMTGYSSIQALKPVKKKR